MGWWPRHASRGAGRRSSSKHSATAPTRPRPVPSRANPAFREIPITIMLGRYDATRLPRTLVGGLWNERVIMGNAAVAGELLGADELDELYRLDASEPEPEDDGDGDEDEDD